MLSTGWNGCDPGSCHRRRASPAQNGRGSIWVESPRSPSGAVASRRNRNNRVGTSADPLGKQNIGFFPMKTNPCTPPPCNDVSLEQLPGSPRPSRAMEDYIAGCRWSGDEIPRASGTSALPGFRFSTADNAASQQNRRRAGETAKGKRDFFVARQEDVWPRASIRAQPSPSWWGAGSVSPIHQGAGDVTQPRIC